LDVRVRRLLSILMLLQLRVRLTSEELAREFGVSVRTIYRDVEELGAAGIRRAPTAAPVDSATAPDGPALWTDGVRDRAARRGGRWA
jgi:predicted DNA-binding transcriptional regulator YafY